MFKGAAWFRPEIGRSASILASKRPEQLQETIEERVKRMSQEAAESIERRRKQKEKELYGGMTFVPEIDPVSRALGRSPGLQELVENKRGQRVRDIARKTAERIEELNCTFSPCINPYYPTHRNSFDMSGTVNQSVDKSNSSIVSEMKAEERRYEADLTPVGWSECPLSQSHIKEDRTLDGSSKAWKSSLLIEEEGEDGDPNTNLTPYSGEHEQELLQYKP
jgi:hypothetical protein